MGAGWIVGFCYVAIEATFPEQLWARLFAAAAGGLGHRQRRGAAGRRGVLLPMEDLGGARSGCSPLKAPLSSLWRARLLLGKVEEPSGGETASRNGLANLWPRSRSQLGLIAGANVTRSATTSWSISARRSQLTFLLTFAGEPVAHTRGFLPRDAARPWTTAGAGYAMIFALEVGTVGLNVYQAAILQSVYHVSALLAGYVVCSMAMGWTAAAFLVSGAPGRRHSVLIVTGASIVVLWRGMPP